MTEEEEKQSQTTPDEHGQENFSQNDNDGQSVSQTASTVSVSKAKIRKHTILSVLKSNIVLIIAIIAAAVTCFFVPFDSE